MSCIIIPASTEAFSTTPSYALSSLYPGLGNLTFRIEQQVRRVLYVEDASGSQIQLEPRIISELMGFANKSDVVLDQHVRGRTQAQQQQHLSQGQASIAYHTSATHRSSGISPYAHTPAVPSTSISTQYASGISTYAHTPAVPSTSISTQYAQPAASRSPIYFYNRQDPYFEFTNFSRHTVVYNGATYPTSEHLYQAMKFMDTAPDVARKIQRCDGPREALRLAQKNKHKQRPDWFQVNVQKMEEILWLKFTQHPDLGRLLVSTGDAELIEDTTDDAFWGCATDGCGRNELGKALVRLRARLRANN